MSWHDQESDDEAQCIDCGCRVDGHKYGPNVSQCYACAIGEVLAKEQPKPKSCFCGAEVTGDQFICTLCEQKGVRATTYMAVLDWAQPDAELEIWLDEVNRRNDEDRGCVPVEVPEGVGPER